MKTLTYTARKRFTMYFGLIESLVALSILIAGIICRNTANILQDSDTFSAFIGISAGMLGAGLGIFWRTRSLLHDDKRLKASEVRDMDERNQYIAGQSARLAFWATMILTYITAFFTLFFSTALYFFLCFQILAMLVIYLVFARIIGRRFC